MRIAIVTVQVPFTRGGAEVMAHSLMIELIKRGHEAEIVTIPFNWYSSETLINSMLMGRMTDITVVNGEKTDLVIALKFPAYYIKHDNKVVWLLHQHRTAYDLWRTQYGDIHSWIGSEFIRSMIVENDNAYFPEAKKIYTISSNTSNRLMKYNNISSEPLYHPPWNHEKFHGGPFENFVFYPSRISIIKRQRILVEAARYLSSDVKIYIAGEGDAKEIGFLHDIINQHRLQNKVMLLGRISEAEKIDYYSRCLAVYFGAYNEDYGYITLEAFLSRKPVIVHDDSGGPLEFVSDCHNGFIIAPEAKALAHTIDTLQSDKNRARDMGESGYQTIIEKKISWDYVIPRLLGTNDVKA